MVVGTGGIVAGVGGVKLLIDHISEKAEKLVRQADELQRDAVTNVAREIKKSIAQLAEQYDTCLKGTEAAGHRTVADVFVRAKDLMREEEEIVQQLGGSLQATAAAFPAANTTPRVTGRIPQYVYVSPESPDGKIIVLVRGHFPDVNKPEGTPSLCFNAVVRSDQHLNSTAFDGTQLRPDCYILTSLWFAGKAIDFFPREEIQNRSRNYALLSKGQLSVPQQVGLVIKTMEPTVIPMQLVLLPRLPGNLSLIHNEIPPKNRQERKEEKGISSGEPDDDFHKNQADMFNKVGGWNHDEPSDSSDDKGTGALGAGEWYFRMLPSPGYQFLTDTLKPLEYKRFIGNPEPPRKVRVAEDEIRFGARTKQFQFGTSQKMVFTIKCDEEEKVPGPDIQKEQPLALSWGESYSFTPQPNWRDWRVVFTPFDTDRAMTMDRIGELGRYLNIESNQRSGFSIRVKTPEEIKGET